MKTIQILASVAILVLAGGASGLAGASASSGSSSASRTANCYIVSKPGTYSFPTVKGNSTQSVGNVAKAEVLWESFGTSIAPSKGDIIESVSYAAGSGSSAGTITYSTPSTLRTAMRSLPPRTRPGISFGPGTSGCAKIMTPLPPLKNIITTRV